MSSYAQHVQMDPEEVYRLPRKVETPINRELLRDFFVGRAGYFADEIDCVRVPEAYCML